MGGSRPERHVDQSSSLKNVARSMAQTNPDSSLFSSRLAVIVILFIVAAVILLGRLFLLQIVDAEANLNRGDSSREVTVDIMPRRGTIYDRNGIVLATTVDAYNVYCHPRMVSSDKVDELARVLAETFGGKEEDYKAKITQDTNFVYLYKAADEEPAKKIKELGIEGVDLEKTVKRVYPCGAVGSQIIGILNSDGEAITGLELYYDDILGGQAGQKKTEYSKEGVPVPGMTQVTAEVVNGQDIVLSIDVEMQQRLEEAMTLRVEEVQGKTGSAILMDASTGEIYASASSPVFDITDLTKIEDGATNLSGISMAFEPGSIFKPVTMLAALEEGTTQAGQVYFCPNSITIDDYVISDSHDREDVDMDTSTIMADSSNVGMSLIAKDLTFGKLYDYIKKYQITDKTGVDYPGEAGGYLSSRDTWSEVQGYNISFGQGLTATPISMVRFYGALANNGVATTPHFLLDVPTEAEDRTYATSEIVTNKESIAQLTEMMEQVVERGTGTEAQIDGYRVAGKTGTAEIASETGGYKKGEYNISFVGYIPDASMSFVCFVGATDVPGERKTVSAFQDIMSFAIERYNITQK